MMMTAISQYAYSLLGTVLTICGVAQHLTDARASFITTLGRDTVAVESFTRTAGRVEGDIVVRVPSTSVYHYVVDVGADGNVSHATLDWTAADGSGQARHVTLAPERDSLVVDGETGGQHQRATVARNALPVLMVGQGASYGLYASLGLLELDLSRAARTVGDTGSLAAVDIYAAKGIKRKLVRRSPSLVDADYFGIAWTHLTTAADGSITAADATGTTERVQSVRVPFVDAGAVAKQYAAADRAKKGIGLASPNETARGTIGGQLVVATYGSPRKRNRTILGTVVPYDEVWRTGANEATTLLTDRDIRLGTTALPAGAYTLWTVPHANGTVDLIVNAQHGQWGTDHDPAQDIARMPMHVSTASSPRENFAVFVDGNGNTGELRIEWDTFVWSLPITAK